MTTEPQFRDDACLKAASAHGAGVHERGIDIDWERRYSLVRLHKALHRMSCVAVATVTGGNITPDMACLAFDIEMSLLDAA